MTRLWALEDRVFCPPDRGQPGYAGWVVHVGDVGDNRTWDGKPFYWVTVETNFMGNGRTKHVWPSTRLSQTPAHG